MFREAEASDFAAVLELYRDLHPNDEPPGTELAAEVYDQILRTPGLRIFLL